MTASRLASAAILAFALASAAAAEGFKVYPGAKKYTPPDTEQTRAFMSALRPGTTITGYLTNDSFEQVVFFYKTFAKEFTSPGKHPAGKLPNGEEIRKTDRGRSVVISEARSSRRRQRARSPAGSGRRRRAARHPSAGRRPPRSGRRALPARCILSGRASSSFPREPRSLGEGSPPA